MDICLHVCNENFIVVNESRAGYDWGKMRKESRGKVCVLLDCFSFVCAFKWILSKELSLIGL